MSRLQPLLDALRRYLPHGPLDLARQITLFYLTYYAYSLARGVADNPGAAEAAFDNARGVISLERTLNIFVEPAIQAWATSSGFLIDASSWLYVNAQTSITLGALVFIYLFRNDSFYFVRNMMIIGMGIAICGYVLFPTAPPRFFPEWGFQDSVSTMFGVESGDTKVDTLFNPYAAIPSMHVGFSLMIGWSLARLVEHPLLKAAWRLYPFLVVFVIVATGNHFFTDAILGACVAGLAALAARELGRVRPAAWQFGPRPALS